MSREQIAFVVLIGVLCFAAGWVLSGIYDNRFIDRLRRGTTYAATGAVHPGEAVVFDWSDARRKNERWDAQVAQANAKIESGLATIRAAVDEPRRHLAAVPDDR